MKMMGIIYGFGLRGMNFELNESRFRKKVKRSLKVKVGQRIYILSGTIGFQIF